MKSKPKSSNGREASQSLREERKAIADYKERKATVRSKSLKKVLAHNLAEEQQHAKALEQWKKGAKK